MYLIDRNNGPAVSPISPLDELGAYEAMWLEPKATFKTIAEKFARDPTALPSDFVETAVAKECAGQVMEYFRKSGVSRFGVRINHAGDYPKKLRDARYPVELLYFQGAWELAETRCVAVVGSRKATEDGIRRAERVSKALVGEGFTVASGLAEGIDRAAHLAAIKAKGRTISVIGTPLGSYYPKENRELQKQIANEFLLVSQVPILRYARQAVPQNRLFFPERNATMSALAEATIIVEAGETSGSLTQARAAVFQKRKLFILDSCFDRRDISWPAKFEQAGAIRVRKPEDIFDALGK